MSMVTLAAQADAWRSVRAAGLAVLLGVVLLGLVFWQEIVAAVSVWDSSTAYNHCFLVLPIALWMAYERRGVLLTVPARPMLWVAWLILPLGAVWLIAERLGIMEGRQLMAIACLDLLFLAVLGWRLCRGLGAPILYLFFLVPFGAFLTPALQEFTAKFIVIGLNMLGVPNFSDGNVIEIPEGVFFVAEACAGLRFLIASIAFGVLYACTMYRSPGRRVAFIAASIVVPVIANGFRALGIVAAGHWIGSAQAAAADHLIYGWLFFSAVTLLLILAGLPFRQDGQTASPAVVTPAVPARPLRLILPAVLAGALAAVGPVLANRLDHAAAAERVVAPGMMPGCSAAEDTADASDLEMLRPSNAVMARFACGEGAVAVTIVLFPPRTNPNVIRAAQRTLTGQDAAEDTEMTSVTDASGAVWRLVTTTKPSRATATQLWIDDQPVPDGLRSRLRQARNSIAGAGFAPALVTVGGAPGRESRQVIQQFLGDDQHAAALSRTMAVISVVAASH